MECGGRVRRECALTAPPRMNTMPGTLITPFSPPTCTFAVEMNLMNPTRGPNMSRDCTWTFSMKSFGSALILTNQSLKTSWTDGLYCSGLPLEDQRARRATRAGMQATCSA